MRLVTRYPPTTLMVAKVTAAVPNKTVKGCEEKPEPEASKAPTRVIPEIAFAPDIRGVCRIEGTFEISSTPRKMLKTRTKKK